MEQTYSDTSAGDKIEVYEFLEALGLLDNEVSPVNMDDDDNNESDIDEEDSDDDQDNYWDPRKRYTGWDYKRRFGEDALSSQGSSSSEHCTHGIYQTSSRHI